MKIQCFCQLFLTNFALPFASSIHRAWLDISQRSFIDLVVSEECFSTENKLNKRYAHVQKIRDKLNCFKNMFKKRQKKKFSLNSVPTETLLRQ